MSKYSDDDQRLKDMVRSVYDNDGFEAYDLINRNKIHLGELDTKKEANEIIEKAEKLSQSKKGKIIQNFHYQVNNKNGKYVPVGYGEPVLHNNNEKKLKESHLFLVAFLIGIVFLAITYNGL